jgi:hypothetical protein
MKNESFPCPYTSTTGKESCIGPNDCEKNQEMRKIVFKEGSPILNDILTKTEFDNTRPKIEKCIQEMRMLFIHNLI